MSLADKTDDFLFLLTGQNLHAVDVRPGVDHRIGFRQEVGNVATITQPKVADNQYLVGRLREAFPQFTPFRSSLRAE